MERDFYKDELEDLIKEKADQFRMYPSERVWKNIHRDIHPRRKWYLYGFALLLSGLGLYSVNELTSSSQLSQLKDPAIDQHAREAEVVDLEAVNPFIKRRNDAIQNRGSEDVDNLRSEELMNQGSEVVEKRFNAAIIPINTPVKSIESPKIIEAPLVNISLHEQGTEQSQVAESLQEEIPERYKRVNWLHDQVIQKVSPEKLKRLSFQVAVAPTMNYRVLKGGSNTKLQSSINNIPIALYQPGNVDNLVNHKPALGFEVGATAYYALTKKLSIKAGLQFNYSRYFITAFRSQTEITSIALNRDNLSGASVQSLSNLNNFGGYAEKDIQNQYFQLSAPFGAEMSVLGKKKLQLHVAATIQPTYLLNRNSYLMSNDLKSYTQSPSLVRRWNVNTAVETFISYKTGGIRWQLGPQFRYQLLSSYIREYPISEYLMEYGVKFGVTKTIR
jgi:hypothetical protein